MTERISHEITHVFWIKQAIPFANQSERQKRRVKAITLIKVSVER